ncbi:hypothetical protein CKAH01_03786 [Colletotrichum kahawae]|uniref:Uncharacterized protein n=1 Tax=Colletotrichum kahawae TaxID=34407 RepID=A0AAE0D9P8_COLKA|nr:hypothetical protein CKAH01_03786 [Colletotrichum kahawae]
MMLAVVDPRCCGRFLPPTKPEEVVEGRCGQRDGLPGAGGGHDDAGRQGEANGVPLLRCVWTCVYCCCGGMNDGVAALVHGLISRSSHAVPSLVSLPDACVDTYWKALLLSSPGPRKEEGGRFMAPEGQTGRRMSMPHPWSFCFFFFSLGR